MLECGCGTCRGSQARRVPSPWGGVVDSVLGLWVPDSAPAPVWACGDRGLAVRRLFRGRARGWWSVGVELEGGWDWRPGVRGQFAGDSSVTASADWWQGEVRSPVFRSVGALVEWLRQAYPHKVDSSCGLHLHLRGSWGLLSGLVSRDGQMEFLRRLEAWGRDWGVRSERFYSRLRGENSYCCGVQWGGDLVRAASERCKGSWRYRAVNLTTGVYGPGRVEIRVLPMFVDVRVAAAAVAAAVRIATEVAREFGGPAWVVGEAGKLEGVSERGLARLGLALARVMREAGRGV